MTVFFTCILSHKKSIQHHSNPDFLLLLWSVILLNHWHNTSQILICISLHILNIHISHNIHSKCSFLRILYALSHIPGPHPYKQNTHSHIFRHMFSATHFLHSDLEHTPLYHTEFSQLDSLDHMAQLVQYISYLLLCHTPCTQSGTSLQRVHLNNI